MKKIALLAVLATMLFALPAMAADVKINVTWDQVISADFGGWRLYGSTAPDVIVKPENLLLTIPYDGAVKPGYSAIYSTTAPDGAKAIWYLVLTAFKTTGQESKPSAEVTVPVDLTLPDAPFNFKFTIQMITVQ